MNNNDVVLSRLGILEEVSSEIFEETSEDELDQRSRELDQRERNSDISLSDAQRFYNDLRNLWANSQCNDYEDILDYLKYEFDQQNNQSHKNYKFNGWLTLAKQNIDEWEY